LVTVLAPGGRGQRDGQHGATPWRMRPSWRRWWIVVGNAVVGKPAGTWRRILALEVMAAAVDALVLTLCQDNDALLLLALSLLLTYIFYKAEGMQWCCRMLRRQQAGLWWTSDRDVMATDGRVSGQLRCIRRGGCLVGPLR
jgi:hypothetical protein